MSFFFISANRHDSDRVELQLGFDGEFETQKKYDFEVNMYLLLPKSLGLAENFDKEALFAQLQSHLRLHTHAGNPQNPTKLDRVKERLELLTHHLSEESLKFFALEIEAYLKFEIKSIKKALQKKRSTENRSLNDELKDIQLLVDEYRALLSQRHLTGKKAKNFSFESFDHDLLLLDEYISHLYVSLLSHLKYFVQNKKEAQAHEDLAENITLFAKKEAEHRKLCHYFLQEVHAKQQIQEEEYYLRRASLLKKYFQKTLFIRASLSNRESRLLIPVYGLSAAIAATFAILVQVYHMDRMSQKIGFSTVAFISLAVFAYVVKDILKDYFRKYFFSRSQKFFPDFKIKLSYSHNETFKNLGKVDEFLTLSKSTSLPKSIKEIRYTARDQDLEPEVEEDVLEYKKVFHLNLKSLELKEHYHWGIREVLRIRLDRFTTSMDDPTKMLHLLREDGSIESHLGHRVYFLHLAVTISPLKQHDQSPEGPGTLKVFRIKMDKTGILSVESLKTRQNKENESKQVTL